MVPLPLYFSSGGWGPSTAVAFKRLAGLILPLSTDNPIILYSDSSDARLGSPSYNQESCAYVVQDDRLELVGPVAILHCLLSMCCSPPPNYYYCFYYYYYYCYYYYCYYYYCYYYFY